MGNHPNWPRLAGLFGAGDRVRPAPARAAAHHDGGPLLRALEPRILPDGAALSTAADAVDDSESQTASAEPEGKSTPTT